MLIIRDGDSRWDLQAQLFDIGRYPFADRKRFKLRVALSGTSAVSRILDVETLIYGMQADGSTGNLWLIRGNLMLDGFDAHLADQLLPFQTFRGRYNVRKREGHLQPG